MDAGYCFDVSAMAFRRDLWSVIDMSAEKSACSAAYRACVEHSSHRVG